MSKVLRIKQWIKNFLLFVAPISAAVEVTRSNLWTAFCGFIVFSATSSIGYIGNDWSDRTRDRLHKTKRNRPVASGSISKKSIFLCLITLLIVTIIFSTQLNQSFLLIVLVYLINTLLYSFYLKRIPILEMILVSLGFFLRLLSGAVLFELEISEWFYLISIFGSLFIVSIKRNNEIRLGEDDTVTREVLKSYSENFVESLINIFLTLTIMTYCLWAYGFKSGNLAISISSITFLTTLLSLLLQSKTPVTESPEDFIFADKLTRYSLSGTFLLVIYGIYIG